MLSKNWIKYIRSLEMKKIRDRDHVFVAEGPKVVGDLLAHLRATCVVATEDWMRIHANKTKGTELIEVCDEELRKISFLRHPQQVMAVFTQPSTNEHISPPLNELSLALDDVQDPGNLGTIIRVADWFGISHVYCSKGTADIYNPKVVQSTMGSIGRVHVEYIDLHKLITSVPADFPVYATLLDGRNIYEEPLTTNGLIVMGNEGRGISLEICKLVTRRLLIPNYPQEHPTADSLNVAIATAIVCSEFRRIKGFRT